jgi:hypothetical protein
MPDGEKDYVVLTLLGTVKGKHLERENQLPAISITQSGIPVRHCLKRVLATNRMCGRTKGLTFCDKEGIVLISRDMNTCLHDVPGELLMEHPTLFLADIKSRSDIEEKYDTFRSFRHGSDSQAMAMNVSGTDIDMVNRWQKKEATGTGRPGFQMKNH